MGSILQNKDIDFKFIFPKNKVKGNPEPTISFVKYKYAWHYSNPNCWKLLSYKLPKSYLISKEYVTFYKNTKIFNSRNAHNQKFQLTAGCDARFQRSSFIKVQYACGAHHISACGH